PELVERVHAAVVSRDGAPPGGAADPQPRPAAAPARPVTAAKPGVPGPAQSAAPGAAPGRGRPRGPDPILRAGRGHADCRQGGARRLERARVDPAAVWTRRGPYQGIWHALPDRPTTGGARRAVRPALPRGPAVGQSQRDPHDSAGDLPADRP